MGTAVKTLGLLIVPCRSRSPPTSRHGTGAIPRVRGKAKLFRHSCPLACVISSAVPQSIFNLRNLSRRYLRVEPLIIRENIELGMQVRTSKPSEVGSD
jgi:hypothetical protein